MKGGMEGIREEKIEKNGGGRWKERERKEGRLPIFETWLSRSSSSATQQDQIPFFSISDPLKLVAGDDKLFQ